MSTELQFRDFLPQPRSHSAIGNPDYGPFPDLVERVNRWIEEDSIDVLHVETLLFPGSPAKHGDAVSEVLVDFGPMQVPRWFQAVRVWYRE